MIESIISEPADEEWVQLIEEAKRLGISIEQIRLFLEKTCEASLFFIHNETKPT